MLTTKRYASLLVSFLLFTSWFIGFFVLMGAGVVLAEKFENPAHQDAFAVFVFGVLSSATVLLCWLAEKYGRPKLSGSMGICMVFYVLLISVNSIF